MRSSNEPQSGEVEPAATGGRATPRLARSSCDCLGVFAPWPFALTRGNAVSDVVGSSPRAADVAVRAPTPRLRRPVRCVKSAP